MGLCRFHQHCWHCWRQQMTAFTVSYNISTQPYGHVPQTVDFDMINISQECDCWYDTSFFRTLSVFSVSLMVVGHIYKIFHFLYRLLPSYQRQAEEDHDKIWQASNSECKWKGHMLKAQWGWAITKHSSAFYLMKPLIREVASQRVPECPAIVHLKGFFFYPPKKEHCFD